MDERSFLNSGALRGNAPRDKVRQHLQKRVSANQLVYQLVRSWLTPSGVTTWRLTDYLGGFRGAVYARTMNSLFLLAKTYVAREPIEPIPRFHGELHLRRMLEVQVLEGHPLYCEPQRLVRDAVSLR